MLWFFAILTVIAVALCWENTQSDGIRGLGHALLALGLAGCTLLVWLVEQGRF